MDKTLIGAGNAVVKGAVELLLFLPLLLVAAVTMIEDGSRLLWIVSLLPVYGAGYAAAGWLRLTRLYKLLPVVLLIGAGHGLLFAETTIQVLVIGFISSMAAYRGGRLNGALWSERFRLSYAAAGIAIYFVASIAFPRISGYEPYLSLLVWCGIGSLFAALHIFNSVNLKQETFSKGDKPDVSRNVLWQNRILIVIFVIIAVIIAEVQRIDEALKRLRDWLNQWLQKMQNQTNHIESPPAMNTQPPMFPEEGPSEPSVLMVWLEQIMMVIGYLGIVLFFLFVLYKILKKAPGSLQKLYRLLSRLFNGNGYKGNEAGYVDEVEMLSEWEGLKNKFKDRWIKRMPGRTGTKADNMTNEQKVRDLYRRSIADYMKRGYERKLHYTPKETQHDIEHWDQQQTGGMFAKLSLLYERVRYGNANVTDDQLKSIRDQDELKNSHLRR
ncbi:DUF4129 domain-containing protein [Paenibacillus tarimensis]